MYIIQDKKTSEVLYNSPALPEGLSGKEIYPDFDPNTMLMLKSNMGTIPDFFKADKDGFVVPKTYKEKVEDGDLSIDEVFQFDANGEASQENFDPVKHYLKDGKIKNQKECELVLNYLTSKFEHELAQQYSPGYETKLLKEYIAWVAEGKPAKDNREKNYVAMQNAVAKLKSSYKPTRDKVKKMAVAASKKK